MFRYDLLKMTRRLVNLVDGYEYPSMSPEDRLAKAKIRAEQIHNRIRLEAVQEDGEITGDLYEIFNLKTDIERYADDLMPMLLSSDGWCHQQIVSP